MKLLLNLSSSIWFSFYLYFFPPQITLLKVRALNLHWCVGHKEKKPQSSTHQTCHTLFICVRNDSTRVVAKPKFKKHTHNTHNTTIQQQQNYIIQFTDAKYIFKMKIVPRRHYWAQTTTVCKYKTHQRPICCLCTASTLCHVYHRQQWIVKS